MNIFERLISGYPNGDVAPQDFIDHLSIGADGWVGGVIIGENGLGRGVMSEADKAEAYAAGKNA